MGDNDISDEFDECDEVDDPNEEVVSLEGNIKNSVNITANTSFEKNAELISLEEEE